MGRFNNYQSDLVYTPQTFEKLAVLPMMLKKRQDDMEAQTDLIGINIANTKVAEGYQDAYNKKRQEFDNKSKELAERMASEGAGNPNLIKEFQNLKRQYNQDAAATGIMGAGAQRYKDDVEAERLYSQYGVEKAGQSPEAVSAAWRKKYAKDQAEIKQGLAADPNYIAAPIVHEYAPKAVDVADFAGQLQRFIGSTSYSNTTEALEKLNGAVVKDTATGMLKINQNSDAWKNNSKQVEGFVQLMNSNLMDTASPLNQHLRYNGKDPRDYMKDVQSLATMLTSSDIARTRKESYIGGDNSSEDVSGGEDKNKDNILLEERTNRSPDVEITIPTFNGGQPVKLNGGNVNLINQQMENIEASGLPIVNTREYATQKQAVIDFKKNLADWEMAHGKEMKEQFQKIKPKADIAFPGAPIVTYKDYDDFVAKRAQMRDYLIKNDTSYKGLKDQRLAAFDENTEAISQKAREMTGASDLMFKQNIYGIGYTDESAKMVESSVPYLKSNSKYLKEQLSNGSFSYQIDKEGNQTEIEDSTGLNAEMADDIRVSSIATKNAKGVPSVGIEMTFGTGENKYKKYVDLEVGSDTSSVARGVVKRMYDSTTDPKTRYILESILDSADVNQIVPDSKEFTAFGTQKGGASKIQSNMIVAYNKASATGGKGNTINDTGNYQLVSEGAHYALNVKQKNDKTYHMYNINDLLYDRVPKGNSTTDRQKQDMKNSQVAALCKLIGYNSKIGVQSFSEGVSPIAPEDNGAKRNRLSLALNDFELNYNRAGNTQPERDAAVNTFIERTKDIGLKSMNKAAFLKH